MNAFLFFQLSVLLGLISFVSISNGTYISMECSEETSYSSYDSADTWYKSGYYLLNGMDSYYDNGKKDRKFKMRYCRPSSSSYHSLTSYQTIEYTDLDDYFIRGCGGNSAIYWVYSYHDNGKEDRRFRVKCAALDNDIQLDDCSWHGYYPSDWKEQIDFQCPDSGIIRTIESYHNNGAEDRKYKFECCRMIESEVSLVTMTTHTNDFYTNEWDGYHDNLKSGYFLSGLYSYHDNTKEDRRFQWKYGTPSSSDENGYISYTTLDWTEYDSEWTRSCSSENLGHSALIRGVSSHSNNNEDRQWQFYCGNLDTSKYGLDNCAYTGYLNTWDDTIDFDCPNNGVIRSIWSTHNNNHEDRLFTFECCNIIEADYEFNNIQGFWNKIIGPIGVGTISRSVTLGIETTNGQEVTESYSESISIAISQGFEFMGASGSVEITGTVAVETSTTISNEVTLSSETTDTMTCGENVQYLYQFMLISDEATVSTTSFWCTNVVNPSCGPGFFDCEMGDADCDTCLDTWPTE